MDYKIGTNRSQIEFYSLEDLVEEDSIARVIDLFVDNIVKDRISFKTSERGTMGRPSYPPLAMMKLYLYGYYEGIKSSRRLERLCHVNVEAQWLMNGLRPDFRTISFFRKDNIDRMSEVFDSFVTFCKRDVPNLCGKQIYSGFTSIDGTKIRAQQSKDGCFTANKIDDRIENDKNRIAEYESYLREMDEEDKKENFSSRKPKGRMSKKEVEKALNGYKERLEKHEIIRKEIEKTGEQYSENDPDARLMKNHYGGYAPAYNIQSAVDSDSHMVEGFLVTNQCTDHGMMAPTMENVLEDSGAVRSVVADNGYNNVQDMADCLEKGIIPNVFLDRVKDAQGHSVHKKECEISFPYEPNEITDEDKASCKPEDISRCLRAGVVPDCYKDCLDGRPEPDVRKHSIWEMIDEDPYGIDKMTDDERLALALEGAFVRDIKGDKVFCPQGKILRRKSTKKNGTVRYCNKLACKNCPFKCYAGNKTTQWKEVDFSPTCRIKSGNHTGPQGKKKKVGSEERVYLKFRPDRSKLNERKCLSEHPFGTIKRFMNGDHFLLKRLSNVRGEIALTFLGYNLRRIKNILGIDELIRVLGTV